MHSAFKESVLAGLAGGAISACMAFLVNQYLAPFPQSVLDNALGNGISGFVSGLLSGFIGVFLVLRKVGKTN